MKKYRIPINVVVFTALCEFYSFVISPHVSNLFVNILLSGLLGGAVGYVLYKLEQ